MSFEVYKFWVIEDCCPLFHMLPPRSPELCSWRDASFYSTRTFWELPFFPRGRWKKDFKSDDKVVAVLYLFLENLEVPINTGPVSSWNFAKSDLLNQDPPCRTLNLSSNVDKFKIRLCSYTRSNKNPVASASIYCLPRESSYHDCSLTSGPCLHPASSI